MDKRRFLGAATLAGVGSLAGPARAAGTTKPVATGPGLLTLSGAVGDVNRGPLDPALDQLMFKQGVRFERAFVFDSAALRRLPLVSIRPTLEYDGRPHTLAGPLLTDVLLAAGVADARDVHLALRAVDGYAAPVGLADVRAWRMIVALTLDGASMALGGLGPQWAVYDADTLAPFKNKPLKDRFAACPWGLYSIEITRGA